MYIDTITLFCLHDSTWRATQIDKVDLNTDRSAIIARLGENSKDRAKLHIAYNPNTLEVADDIVAVKPREYSGAEGTITLASGDDFSFFLNGEWNGAATIDDNDYPQGFYNYMNETHDVYAISSVAKYSVIPHFEVMAR